MIKRAQLDQRQGARHRVRSSAPGAHVGRGLRATAQTGSEPRLLCGGSRGIEDHVFGMGHARWADWAAIDPRRLDCREKAPVETRVALRECAVTSVVIEVHSEYLPRASAAI